MAYNNIEEGRAASRDHYRRNRSIYMDRAKAHNKKMGRAQRTYILNYLSKHCCVDCGATDPIILEFDHRNPKEKRFNVGDIVGRGYSIKTLATEIGKCDVRCANCHRRKTVRGQQKNGKVGILCSRSPEMRDQLCLFPIT